MIYVKNRYLIIALLFMLLFASDRLSQVQAQTPGSLHLAEGPGPENGFVAEKGMELKQATDKTHSKSETKLNRKHKTHSKSEVALMDLVRGTVTDGQNGETLPGVNIMVKGTTIGTSTDQNGNYELDAPSYQDTLVVSFVGYQSWEEPINGRQELNIALQPQAIAGEELVVVGYGTQQKSSLTGSIAKVENEDLDQIPVGS